MHSNSNPDNLKTYEVVIDPFLVLGETDETIHGAALSFIEEGYVTFIIRDVDTGDIIREHAEDADA